MRNELSDAKAWADRVLRNGLLDAPEDDAHLRVLLSALSASPSGEGEPVAWLTTGGDVTRSHAYAGEQSANDPENYPVALFAHPPGGLSVEEVARIAWEAGRAWSLDMGEEDSGPWPPTAGQFGWQEDDSEARREAERHKAQAILAAMEPRRADLIDIEQGREG